MRSGGKRPCEALQDVLGRSCGGVGESARLNYLDLTGHRLFLVPELNSPSVLLRLKLLGLKQAPMSPIAPRRCTRSASSLPPKFSAR